MRVVAEWIEPQERSTAMGIINAGTAIGSLLAPPLIGFVLLGSGWRAVFFVAARRGCAGSCGGQRAIAAGTEEAAKSIEGVPPIPWLRLVRLPNVQALVFAKFMSDSAWYFLLFWLPKYLYDARGFDIKQVSYYGWIPYAASGVGSFLGGWFSSCSAADRGARWMWRERWRWAAERGVYAGGDAGAAGSGVDGAGAVQRRVLRQQSWSGLVMTVPADIFPLSAVGTVSGLIGFGGAIGGAIFGVVAGYLLGHGVGYGTLFVLWGRFT